MFSNRWGLWLALIIGVAALLIAALGGLPAVDRVYLIGAGMALCALSGCAFWMDARWAWVCVAGLEFEIKQVESEPLPTDPTIARARDIYLCMARNSLDIANAKLSNREWDYARHSAAMGKQHIKDYRRAQGVTT